DSMTVFFRLFLLFFAFWFVILVRLTGLADKEDGQDFYTLLLGATLGMCIMASANHLMTVFLGVEMASVPSYVMAGIIKGRRRASEASLKYAVYGAGAAGVMLYGISLLAGLVGSAHLPTIAKHLAAMDIPGMIARGEGGTTIMVLVLAGLMISVGLAFKLSAVPFHFWCPDVFEGASAEVDAFLSVASKGAAMALLVRVAIGVSTAAAPASTAGPPTAIHAIPAHIVAYQHAAKPINLTSKTAATLVAQQAIKVAKPQPQSTNSNISNTAVASTAPLAPVRQFIVLLLAIMAAVTCTFGNLAAYGQTNIKRLLAYSTIAHAGYMIMAVAAAVQLAGTNVDGAHDAVAALLFYLAVYVFMNLGAFSIVAFVRNAMDTEEIADYAGLIRSAPFTSVALTTILVSLIGLPPLVGFVGKFAIFSALVDARENWVMIALLVIAGINTAISLIYYLRVAKVVCMDPEPADRGPVSIGFVPVVYIFVIAVPVLVYGILPARILEIAHAASQQLLM
ncbi:MAG TPA: NADH-quinone oxidoreductase subunit N, partial [Lacipirellulaceae bacterium]|nr:NADH-quinone oxidoreductase subunit N [Lacipirellulaceae bacterium]